MGLAKKRDANRFINNSSVNILRREGKRRRGEEKREMLGLRGEPLVRKMALLAKYLVFPGAMAAAVIYSPPDYALPNKKNNSSAASSSN